MLKFPGEANKEKATVILTSMELVELGTYQLLGGSEKGSGMTCGVTAVWNLPLDAFGMHLSPQSSKESISVQIPCPCLVSCCALALAS